MRAIHQVVDPAVLQEAKRKRNLITQIEELATRRFTDDAERQAFITEETTALGITAEEIETEKDADLLLAVNPTR